MSPQIWLVAAVGAVGVLHTMVPDHWVPITLVARQEGWSRGETARAAFGAGIGHSFSTLAIGLVVWLGGAAFATTFGRALSGVSGAALIGFGLWIAGSLLLERRRAQSGRGHHHRHGPEAHEHPRDHGPSDGGPRLGHRHLHHHGDGREHMHFHRHSQSTWHSVEGTLAVAPPPHEHEHRAGPRRALLFILGSSPMLEGIPAFSRPLRARAARGDGYHLYPCRRP